MLTCPDARGSRAVLAAEQGKSHASWCASDRGLGKDLQRKRQYVEKRLAEIGFAVLPGQGTYFLVADIRPLLPAGSTETDVDFCQRLTVEGGVTLIPVCYCCQCERGCLTHCLW